MMKCVKNDRITQEHLRLVHIERIIEKKQKCHCDFEISKKKKKWNPKIDLLYENVHTEEKKTNKKQIRALNMCVSSKILV